MTPTTHPAPHVSQAEASRAQLIIDSPRFFASDQQCEEAREVIRRYIAQVAPAESPEDFEWYDTGTGTRSIDLSACSSNQLGIGLEAGGKVHFAVLSGDYRATGQVLRDGDMTPEFVEAIRRWSAGIPFNVAGAPEGQAEPRAVVWTNICDCHPETCNCADFQVKLDGDTFIKATEQQCVMIAAAFNAHPIPRAEAAGAPTNSADIGSKSVGEPAPPDEGGGDCHGLDTPERVRFYEHDFYPLSNFSAFSIQWAGMRFDTSEAVYHWEKFRWNGERAEDIRYEIRNAPSAHEAFKIAERNKACRRPDWDAVKDGVMLKIIRAKAAQHEYVRRKLLATGDRLLVEDSWRDSYWGWGPNRDGINRLGKLWMQVRDEIRSTPTRSDGGS